MAGRRGGGVLGPRKRRRTGGNTNRTIPKAAPRTPKTPTGPYRDPVRAPAAAPMAPGYAPMQQSGGMGSYNVDSDPAVAAAKGLAAKMRARAAAVAAAKRAQAAIEYGDPSGVTGLDEKTQKASKENPFSVLKNLEHSNQVGTRDLEEGLNKANLYYSGYRGQQLGENARGYQNARYQAGTSFRALQSGIDNDLADALMNADIYEQNALLNSSGGSYDMGGGGGGPDYNTGGARWPGGTRIAPTTRTRRPPPPRPTGSSIFWRPM